MKHRFALLVLPVLSIVFLSPLALASFSAWPSVDSVEVGQAARTLSPGIEPSGLAWHSGRNQLLLVGDEGQLVAMNADGSSPVLWTVGGDLEDVAVEDPSSTFVYLADEDGRILKYDLSTSRIVQTWSVTSWMPELTCPGGSGTCGMEALTYANGYFYAGYQYNGKIFVLDLSETTAQKVGEFAGLSGDGYTDISGLHYRDGYFYALYSGVMAVLDTQGVVQTTYLVPGSDQEGLALGVDSNNDGDANLFVAEDGTGKIFSYDNFPLYGWSAPAVITDADLDGVSAELDCDDADASVSTPQNYYVDADLDGLGSSTSALLCESYAPVGYALTFTDNNDTIPNAGVEIRKDGIDNNNNGKIDEPNVGFVHPYYSTQDPSLDYSGKIIGYWGLNYGDFAVVYADNSVFRFSLSNTKVKALSVVKPINKTGYFEVTFEGKTVTVNAYTGQVVQ